MCQEGIYVRVSLLEHLQEEPSLTKVDLGFQNRSSWEHVVKLHPLRCSEEDGPLQEHVESRTTFFNIAPSSPSSSRSLVQNSTMELLEKGEVGRRTVE